MSRNFAFCLHTECTYCTRATLVAEWVRVYFKRGVEPKWGVQDEKCGVQKKIFTSRNQENHQNYCHHMSDLKVKMHQNPILAGASPQTPLVGSLQRSPDLIAGFKGACYYRHGRGGECCGVQKILKIDPGVNLIRSDTVGHFAHRVFSANRATCKCTRVCGRYIAFLLWRSVFFLWCAWICFIGA